MAWHGMAGQGRARQGRAGQGRARQGKAGQGKVGQARQRYRQRWKEITCIDAKLCRQKGMELF